MTQTRVYARLKRYHESDSARRAAAAGAGGAGACGQMGEAGRGGDRVDADAAAGLVGGREEVVERVARAV